jgi:hypothetical protein
VYYIPQIEKIVSSNLDSVLFVIWGESDTQEFIIDLLQNQLALKGEDGNENKLWSYSSSQPYAPFTIEKKKENSKALGRVTDHITLFDSGEFYDSYTVIANPKGFTVKADTSKGNNDLAADFGIDIFKLNPANIKVLENYLLKKVAFYVRNKI